MKPVLLRSWRAGVVIALAGMIHLEHGRRHAEPSPAVVQDEARRIFPSAASLSTRDPTRGGWIVRNEAQEPIGYVLLTSPESDDIVGYSGPNNVLVALDAAGSVREIKILESGDTDDHVDLVNKNAAFLESFHGWKPLSDSPPRVAAVSGATLTSSAIAEGIERRLAGKAPSLRFPESITLDDVRPLFPAAAKLEEDQSRLRILDDAGTLLGYAVRTSPWSDNVSGYRGPSETLVALDATGEKVVGLRLRHSYDTSDYVQSVRDDDYWMKEVFAGKTTKQLADLDYARDGIEGVSGATETSWAMAEGMKRRFAAEQPSVARAARSYTRDAALIAVVLGATIMAFTSLRGKTWVRRLWQALLIGYVGLYSGDLLSVGLMAGWSQTSPAWRTAPGLVFLLMAALITPWTTRRQLYCHHICPHGAAQQWLGSITRKKISLPLKWSRVLEILPLLLLAAAVVIAVRGLPFELTQLEPFDAWAWRAAGTATIAIAVVGLFASLFIPQAYCRFGCPTGALLEIVRSHGRADTFGRRDWAALAILVVAFLVRPSLLQSSPSPIAGEGGRRPDEGSAAQNRHELQNGLAVRTPHPATTSPPSPARGEGKETPSPLAGEGGRRPDEGSRLKPRNELHGRAMGTTWSVKLTEASNPSLQRDLEQCFERVENLASPWRPDSDLSRFNSQLATEPQSVPRDLLDLVRRSRAVGMATDGAFDVTIAPLVKLWGFGAEASRDGVPCSYEIETVRRNVGWDRLEIAENSLRKIHPDVTVDLSSIAEGWAVDEVCRLLDARGHKRYLVEAGGEIRAKGEWIVAVDRPWREMKLCDASLSTSGTYRQHRTDAGRRWSHILDPRTGEPTMHATVCVSVIHPLCAEADAWSTALLVLGGDEALQAAERAGVAASIVEERGGETIVRFTKDWPAAAPVAESLAANRE